mmetsp:Transcript_12175/g.36878  ORF Transcript_12175/g.36878 Transcript_12175/m.36878 type:complete len:90 (+) Transcript_12175:66-335(+)
MNPDCAGPMLSKEKEHELVEKKKSEGQQWENLKDAVGTPVKTRRKAEVFAPKVQVPDDGGDGALLDKLLAADQDASVTDGAVLERMAKQ